MSTNDQYPPCDPRNGLSLAEVERLALLLEELGEAAQAIGKILRHGYESYHPDELLGPSNRERLTQELGDVSAAVAIMCELGDIKPELLEQAHKDKLVRVVKYLHHQPPFS